MSWLRELEAWRELPGHGATTALKASITHKPKGMTIADNLLHLNAIVMHEAVLNTEAPRAGAEDGWFLEVH